MSKRKPGKGAPGKDDGNDGKRKGKRPADPKGEKSEDPKALRRAILKGHLDTKGSAPSKKVVRIYVSSAGSDSRAEREALATKVFPSLRTFGRERGFHVQVIDLKLNSGPLDSSEASRRDLHLKQIHLCQKTSIGPSFVAFLGDKYGDRTLPYQIEEEEFHDILSSMKQQDQALLTSWYLKDENHVTPVYILQPITDMIPNYVADDRGKRKDAHNEWAVVSDRLKAVLLEGAVQAFSESDNATLHKYSWSELETEIHHGIVESKSRRSSLWVYRSITDIHKYKDQFISSYTDLGNGKKEEQAGEFIDILKNSKLPLSLPKENLLQYDVKWQSAGINPTTNKEHKKYIDKLCADLENKWKQMILKSLEKVEEQEMKEDLAVECCNVISNAKRLLSCFTARENFLESIKQKLAQQNDTGKRHPIVLCSPPGLGKSSIMAKLMQVVPQWISDPRTIVITRFMNLQDEQLDSHQLLKSLSLQINAAFHEDEEFLPSEDPKELRKQFVKLLKSSQVPLVLLLDDVDALTDDGAELKEWILAKLPPNVTFFMTCLPPGQCDIVSGLKKLLPSTSFINIPPFDTDDVDSYISQRLAESRRTLTSEQRLFVTKACIAGKVPLYCKIILDEALNWNSYTQTDGFSTPTNVEGAMDMFFDRLEIQYRHTIVSRIVGYLTCAKAGLSWTELEDVLSLDDVLLNYVFCHHRPSIRRFPASILLRIFEDLNKYTMEVPSNDVITTRWSHEQLKESVTNRYLQDDNFRKELHQLLAEYFQSKWAGEILKPFVNLNGKKEEAPRYISDQSVFFESSKDETKPNKRVLIELPHHLTLADQEDDLLSCCLTNFSFMYWKLKAASYEKLLEDYSFAFDNGMVHSDISKMLDFMDVAGPALKHEPEQLANQISGRLPAMGAKNSENLKKLLEDACTPGFDCLLSTQAMENENQAKGEVIASFKGHEADIEDFDVSNDLSKVISCGSDGLLNVWQASNCRLIHQINMAEEGPSENRIPNQRCFFCNNDQWAVVIGQEVQIWDLEKEVFVRKVDVPAAESYQIMGSMLKNSTTLITVTGNLWAWDVVTGENLCEVKMDKPGKPAKYLELDQMDDQLAGFENTVVFYRRATRGVQIVEFLDSKRNYKKLNILGKKVEQTHRVAMACSSTGLLAYLFYPLAKDSAAQPVSLGIIDLSNIKEIHQVFEANNLSMASQIGSRNAYIFCNGEEGFLFSTMEEETSTNIYVWKKGEEKSQQKKNKEGNNGDVELLTTKHDSLFCVRSAMKSKMFAVYAKTPNDVKLEDIYFAAETSEKEKNETEPEPGLIMDTMQSPDQRFLYYLTADDKIAVWDLAERRTVRIMAAPFYLPYGTFVSESQVAAIATNQEVNAEDSISPKVILVDLRDGKVIHPDLAQSWNVPNFNFRVIDAGNDTLVFPGPKPHQVTGIKLQTEKVVWTMEVKDTEEIAGLIVSSNKAIMLAEVPQTTEQLKEDRENPQKRETHLYCFDLQQRRRLPDLKVTARGALSTSLTETQQAALSPDGKYYASIVDTEDSIKVAVWDTTNGKRRWFADGQDLGEPRAITLSKDKNFQLFISHSPVSGTKGLITSWNLKTAAEISRIETEDVATAMSISTDGHFLAYVTEAKKNVVVLYDIKSSKRSRSYYADNNINAMMITSKAEFLIVSVKGQAGLSQLCLHNSKEQEELTISEGKNGKDHEREMSENVNDINSIERVKLDKLRKENDPFGEFQFVDLTADDNNKT